MGYPIKEYYLPNSVNPQISYAQRFAEFEACIAAGLDIYEWEHGEEYSIQFKADILVWYENNILIKANVESAIRQKQEAQSKRKR